MVFQFTSWHLTLALKGQIKVLWFHWVCIIDNVLLTAELSGREASCLVFNQVCFIIFLTCSFSYYFLFFQIIFQILPQAI